YWRIQLPPQGAGGCTRPGANADYPDPLLQVFEVGDVSGFRKAPRADQSESDYTVLGWWRSHFNEGLDFRMARARIRISYNARERVGPFFVSQLVISGSDLFQSYLPIDERFDINPLLPDQVQESGHISIFRPSHISIRIIAALLFIDRV